MTRRARTLIASALFAAAAPVLGCGPGKPPPVAKPAPKRPQPLPTKEAVGRLETARELDQQGVRAFSEGRFRDALRFFDEAHKRGGPSSELWNMARCHQKLDEAEDAAHVIERYLENKDLSEADRSEAKSELAEIGRRPSRVVVLSTPAGAKVYLGEKKTSAVGRTPMAIDLAAGAHVIVIDEPGYAPYTEKVTLRYGRPEIVETALEKESR